MSQRASRDSWGSKREACWKNLLPWKERREKPSHSWLGNVPRPRQCGAVFVLPKEPKLRGIRAHGYLGNSPSFPRS
jgi:hypothetical protein